MGSKNILPDFLIIKITKKRRRPEDEGDEETIGESFPNLLAEGRFPSGPGAEDTPPDPQDGAWGRGAARAEPRVAN